MTLFNGFWNNGVWLVWKMVWLTGKLADLTAWTFSGGWRLWLLFFGEKFFWHSVNVCKLQFNYSTLLHCFYSEPCDVSRHMCFVWKCTHVNDCCVDWMHQRNLRVCFVIIENESSATLQSESLFWISFVKTIAYAHTHRHADWQRDVHRDSGNTHFQWLQCVWECRVCVWQRKQLSVKSDFVCIHT